MSDFQFLLSGTGSPITLQAGFQREVESVTPVYVGGPAHFTFFAVPSGPMLFQTSGAFPGAVETLNIAESTDPTDIVNWIDGKANGATVRPFTLPVGQSFKQFIPVNGPFIGLMVVGASALNVWADGLIQWAPSTINMAQMILVNNLPPA